MITEPVIEIRKIPEKDTDKENNISSYIPPDLNVIQTPTIKDDNIDQEKKSKEEKLYENLSKFLDEVNYMIDDLFDIGEDYEKYKKILADLRNEVEEKYNKDKKTYIFDFPPDLNTAKKEKISKGIKDENKEKYNEEAHYELMITVLGIINHLMDSKYDLGDEYDKFKKVFADLRNELEEKHNKQINNDNKQINNDNNNDDDNDNDRLAFSNPNNNTNEFLRKDRCFYCKQCWKNFCKIIKKCHESYDSYKYKDFELIKCFLLFLLQYIIYIIFISIYEFKWKKEEGKEMPPLFFALTMAYSALICFIVAIIIYLKKFSKCMEKPKNLLILLSIVLIFKGMCYLGLYYLFRYLVSNDNSYGIFLGSFCFKIIYFITLISYIYRKSGMINFISFFLYGIFYAGIASLIILITLGISEFKTEISICSVQIIILNLGIRLSRNSLDYSNFLFNSLIIEFYELIPILGPFSMMIYYEYLLLVCIFKTIFCMWCWE